MMRSSRYLIPARFISVAYKHLRAHETKANLECRLQLEKQKKRGKTTTQQR